MPMILRMLAAAASWAATAQSAAAAEPVRQVAVHVEPFYSAARKAGDAPVVRVGKTYDALLASTRREDILAARDKIVADPRVVTPMTLMVLAIRLYDMGLRDDAVFWFYAAKDRYGTLSEVAVAGTPLLAQSNEAMRNFSTLAGPVINGYAFCDAAKQKAARVEALAWVEANPYAVVFMNELPARSADRAAALAAAVRSARASAAKESAHLADPKNREAFDALRKYNEADAKFCWK